MKINFLHASYGDCIHISVVYENKERNILIDSGLINTYLIKGKKATENGELKKLIDEIRSKKDQFIDLLVLTHVDDDHIGGVLEWFRNDLKAHLLIKEVWFNSGRLINSCFEKNQYNNSIFIKSKQGSNTSIRQGVFFEDYITEHNIWFKELILNENPEIERYGLKFHILSPNIEKLKLLLEKWEFEMPNSTTGVVKNDYDQTLLELSKNDFFEEDDAKHNGSSIAFILTYNDINFLFLSDSHPSVIINSLKKLNFSGENPLTTQIVKVSHHGSKKNMNEELFNIINSDIFIISTDGKRYKHPNKQLLARLILNSKKRGKNIKIYFNYPDQIGKIFSDIDFTDFNNFQALPLISEFEF